MSNTLTLAQQLGATVFMYKGDDPVATILHFAREYRVGHIVIGNSGRKQPLWQRLLGRRSMIERLIQESRGMTIVVADLRHAAEQQPDTAGGYLSDLRKHLFSRSDRKRQRDERDAPIFHANVLLWNEVLEKEAAIRQLLEAICATHAAIPFDYAWRAVLEREKQGSTFIGEEIAIPHAKIEGIDAPVLAVGVSKIGILDPGSGHTATIMFLMLSPVSRPDSHVKLLAQISKMAGDNQWRSAVNRAATQIEVMQKVRQWLADRKA